MNNDTEIIPGALEGMVEFMDGTPSAGACCGKLFFPNMTRQLGANMRRLPQLLDTAIELLGIHRLWPSNSISRKFFMLDDDFDKVLSVDQPAGTCLMVRKEVVDTVGLLDEEYFILCEDVDWCLRVKKAGWKIYFLPQCRILHYQSGSFKSWSRKHWELSNIRSLDYYYRKNRGALVFFLLRAMLTANLLVKSILLIPLLARGANTREAAGLVFGYLGICKDILARKKRLGPSPPGGERLEWHSPRG